MNAHTNEAQAAALARIRSGPTGPKVAAFFDYDGTLIDGYSARAHFDDALRRRELGLTQLIGALRTALAGVSTEAEYEAALTSTASVVAGKTPEDLAARGRQLFVDQISRIVRPQMWELVQAHREMGHRIVLTTSALPFQAEAAGREIEADDVLSTRLEVVNGRYTGKPAGRTLWGPGKAAAVRALARSRDLDLTESYAYADGNEDVPFLESVGRPTAVSPGNRLREEAATRNWPILDPATPARPPMPLTAARTAAYYGAMLGGIGLGTAAAVLRRDPKLVTRAGLPLGNRVGLALSGVRIDVQSGREHLTDARPAVFVFNHQSKLDAPILIELLGGELAGVGKAEIKKVPGVGQFLESAGVVFVDRKNSPKAQAAVAPLVSKIREDRLSVMLSPEGTRLPSPRIGPFKTGAFHMAMQAGVPIVPIVIRNAAELQWRGGILMNPGTIEVAVLDPVDTSGWRPETVRDHAAEVCAMFVHTLAHWPGGN